MIFDPSDYVGLPFVRGPCVRRCYDRNNSRRIVTIAYTYMETFTSVTNTLISDVIFKE